MKKFNYESFAAALECACVTSVKTEMKMQIPITKNDVFRLLNILRKYNRDEFYRYLNDLKKHWKSTPEYNNCMVYLSPRLQWVSLMAIETVGTEKADFELSRAIIQWYGIIRSRAIVFKDYIPQDEREGLYSGEYDGPRHDEFVLDHIGLDDDDRLKMEQVIEHNQWEKQQLVA